MADVSPDPTLVRLGERVRLRRLAKPMQQSELGDAIGRSRSSVANLESGRQDITVTVLARLADALGCDVGELLDETPAERLAVSRAPWLDLASRVTASERTYAGLAEECWRDHDYLKAIRYRGMAEGLAMARDHHADVVGGREAT